MNRHLYHILALISLLGALASCSGDVCLNDEPNFPSPDGKTPIELSVGGVDAPSTAVTRAVVTDGTGKTLRAFTGQTRLFFAIVAEDGSGNKKYGFNYGTAAAVNNPAVNSKSAVTFPDNYLYWDDAYARDSKVSVYSIAVANKERGNVALTPGGSIVIGTESPGQAMIPFTTTSPGEPTFKWQIGVSDGGSAFKQDQTIFEWADLVFSNNIVNYTSTGGTDNRLKFHTDPRDGVMYHKFDQGELIYYHALTQFTIKIKCGDGFKGDGTDFKFTNTSGDACTIPNNSFALNGFYGANGVFRVGNGEFDAMTDSNLRNYTSIYKASEVHQKESVGEYYTLKAYVFPGTDMTGSKNDAFSFVIDGNRYDVSLATLLTALQNGTTGGNAVVLSEILEESKYLKAGYNYEFIFTVGKSKINNITATVADWETTTSEDIQPSNAYINISLKRDEGTAVNSADPEVDLYRAADPTVYTGNNYNTWAQYSWATGYTASGAKAALSQTSNNTVYNALDASSSTQWYWPDNNTFYHFRTINKGLTVTSGTNDVVSIYSGPINDTYPNPYDAGYISTAFADGKFNDYIWGAPFKSEVASNTVYSSTYGFCNNATAASGQIYKAIGATLDNILLIQHHMMSDIYVDVETTTGTDAVDMSNTTVKLVRYAKEAKIQMGDGLITGHTNYDGAGTLMTSDVHAAAGSIPAYDFSYRVVPQSMTNSSNGAGTTVGLEITTSDGNVYKVLDLGQQKITDTETKITEWIPGKKYYYKFVLSKTGITKISATVVDWVNIIAADDPVKIQ